MSKTICIVPWTNLVIRPDGRATFCCEAPAPLKVDGRIGSIYEDSIEDLWNSHDLVQVRTAMARGERPETCRACWEREAAGSQSRRLTTNAIYKQIGGLLALDALYKEGAESAYRLQRRPDWFTLELRNVCDLKCRSCSPLFSSRIAADPVHSAWASNEEPATTAATDGPARRLRIVPGNSSAWFDDIDRQADMIASGAEGNAVLHLIGGEPLVDDRPNARIWRLLRALVERGIASNVFLGLATNGQHRSKNLEEIAPRFRGVSLALSIDGHGKLYEYLRHGASWRKLVDNLPWFRQMPNVQVLAIPTLQNANVLNMVTLLRFLDEQELPLGFNAVSLPARLRPTNLPPKIRRIAAERLRRYLESECRPGNVSVVRTYREILEEPGNHFDAILFSEFMAFMNDLDADRGESMRDAAPEFVALVRAAGIAWSEERRRGPSREGYSVFRRSATLQRLNRTISPSDVIFPGFETIQSGAYFESAVEQLSVIDNWLRDRGHPGLAHSEAVADFGCHYGRITRALRAGLPHAAVYAIDIDREAVEFCARELGALPVVTGWDPANESFASADPLPGELDAIVSVSLLTHTPLEHWRSVLRAWERMLHPGGVAAFTFLSERYVDGWQAGKMEHYGVYPREQRDSLLQSLEEEGFGFAALTSQYGGAPLYGIAFTKPDVVKREVAAAGLELIALPVDSAVRFAQDVALVRKPGEGKSRSREAVPAVRDTSVIAFYDPRCYAPEEESEGSYTVSMWSRLTAKEPPGPLPTELGFADPRVAETREAQARLASEHGIHGFCYLYYWECGPRWDSAWRDLVASERPDFPFCFMVTVEGREPMTPEEAKRLFDDIFPALNDRRYLRLDGRPLLVVRDVTRLKQPESITRRWRAAARARDIGELHLSAVEAAHIDDPEDLGFDSFIEGPVRDADQADYERTAAASMTRQWPQHRFFRSVRLDRDGDKPHLAGPYEYWLRSAVDSTRRRVERLVFVDSWNNWTDGRYLEPDDRGGRRALLATRRASRGPASGRVLLRRLRESLGEIDDRTAAILDELKDVLSVHDDTDDQLLATVEAALSQDRASPEGRQRWVAVASRQLPPSGAPFFLDRVGNLVGADLSAANEPIALPPGEVSIAGWSHIESCAPEKVDLFLALESASLDSGAGDLLVRVTHRVARPDVAAALPGYPSNCGFESRINLAGLQPGIYRVAIVQRTAQAAYRDVSSTTIEIDGEACSKE